ncbi:hypothetical protein BC008_03375 [Mastigocoleus testarum BC008]|uniref:CHAT domain-containing protein n=2 Tax=Mastigocoleus TaxID=996924 RepID=A0A0V7ZXF3_9CYAN|nr:hypothetical protein BC008_03375 [Mastigocoleus testarum BC008]
MNKLYFRVYRRLLQFIFGFGLGLLSTLLITTSTVFPVVALEKSSLSIVYKSSIHKSSIHKSSVENLPIEKSSIQGLSDLEQQEQLGKKYYYIGQFSSAVKIWQQVLLSYQSQGDHLNQARVLNNLSLAYQQLGKYLEAKQTISESLKLTQTQQNNISTQNLHKEESTKSLNVIAQALSTRGRLELSMGKPEVALKTWEEAKEFYTKAKNDAGVIRSIINQSQALRSNGLYHRALSILTEVNEILQKQPDSRLKATGLRSLGTSLNLVGRFADAQQALEESLAIAKKLSSPIDISATLIDLGNVANSQQQAKSALNFYQQAVDKATSPNIKIKAQLNIIKTLIDTEKLAKAQLLANQIYSQIANLPANRSTVYAQLNLAKSLTRLQQANIPNSPTIESIAQIVANSYKQAQDLEDKPAQAYALGKLGKLYEQTQQWSTAQDLTQKALMLSQSINTPEITYRLEWQLGRILKAKGDLTGAVANYTQAVNNLGSLRNDLVAIAPDIQFSFQESVEPVYRELVSLLLTPQNSEVSQKSLLQAREVIESLQLAELDDFFREACLDAKPTQVDKFDTQAAVIYPIILADRLEIILSLPKQPLRHYSTAISEKELESTVKKLRKNLVIRTRYSFKPLSKQLYDWLIRPAEIDLAESKVKTLVFVLDGYLRNIPMSTLNDGNQYLLEKYNIALTPGLKILPPQKLKRENIKVLSAGLTEARDGFSPLEYVEEELKKINSQVPGTMLLNQDFTSEYIQEKIQSNFFPIVHIASHGKFSSKVLETFILSWNDRIKIDDLENLLQGPEQAEQKAVELLVLSACETATGDKRAALGLAGMAVKAGARSTLATLWSVNDEATANLMSHFYQELSNVRQTKAEALRNSQLALLRNRKYEHPIYWSPYILVGNWL